MKRTNEKGITLISLIITIVVIVILLGVTELAISDDLFGKADNVEKYTVAAINDAHNDIENIKNQPIINDVIITDDLNEITVVSEVNNITYTSAKITATAKDKKGERLTYKLIIYKYETGEKVDEYGPTISDTESASWDVTGLDANTKYKYKVTVVDEEGNTGTDNNEFTTEPPPNSNKPIIVYANTGSIGTSSFTVKTKATEADGDKLIYELYVSTAQNGSYSRKATSAVVAQNTEVTLTASGLSNYTPYWYYVKAIEAETTEKYYDQSAPVRVHTKCPGPGSHSYTLKLCPNSETSYDCRFCVVTGRRGKTCPGYWTSPEQSSHCLWCGGGGIINYSCSVCDGGTAGYVACSCGSYSDIPISESHTFICYRCTDGKEKQAYTLYKKCSAHGRDDKHYYCGYPGCDLTQTNGGSHNHTETYCSHTQTGEHGEL